MKQQIREVDLYPPLKSYLMNLGFEVKSEILSCDVVAKRGDEPAIIVELKTSINLTILLQAVDRLKLSDTVYIGVPKGVTALKKQRKKIVKLLRMLGIGLIIIDPNASHGDLDIICEPGSYKPRQMKGPTTRLLKEFKNRIGDPNLGGSSTKKGIITAYRQKAVAIADYLLHLGATKASVLAQSLNEPKTRNILYDNVYGWFDRLGKGVYQLSAKGKEELPLWVKRTKPTD